MSDARGRAATAPWAPPPRLAALWIPLGRVGDIEDVARAALFLASDEATWITGAVLRVDRGIVVQ
ncbi:MAG: SDR family oxidoreductase [Deltaproteobacteria bacterium]|nr:MAG: SDR family oxidoreductase [Deltaproteobacteria bacterium]